MNGVVIAMLIWVGSSNGGPGTLPGFETREACERARPAVEEWYRGGNWIARAVKTECRSFPTR